MSADIFAPVDIAAAQTAVPDPTATTERDWYRPAQRAPKMNRAVALGLHPTGVEITVFRQAHCRNCKYRVTGGGGRTGRNYYKCDLYGVSSAEGTDIRLKWPGCKRWFPREQDTRCDGCGAELEVIDLGDRVPALACNECGGMFDVFDWKKPAFPLCEFRMSNGTACGRRRDHDGPHSPRPIEDDQ